MSVQAVNPPAQVAKRGSVQRRNTLYFWAFVGPLALGLVVFVYVPIVWGLIISFFEARNTVTPNEFVGLDNYIYMLTDPNFTKSLVTFIIFAMFIVPTTFFLSLGLALLVNNVTKGQAFFRTVIFLPRGGAANLELLGIGDVVAAARDRVDLGEVLARGQILLRAPVAVAVGAGDLLLH